ncbi:hypothetical protein BOTCAL_0454g00040 [Botryotinia calthae]|uniref:Zn(2)-C6 fungal-type domain-containing protein n=1 Tax=Botryotinia calthae TaxID=38488 RepID=A0A4Y8CMY0_9HELO|nr:hypothetical protein BOTCAL_0454g00040 [Botryotinia calthae]
MSSPFPSNRPARTVQVQPPQDRVISHRPAGTLHLTGLPYPPDLPARSESTTNTTASYAPASTSAPLVSIPNTMAAYAVGNGSQYPGYRPQTSPNSSMSQHTPASGSSDYTSRPANSENPLAYASNNESQYHQNATQAVSENRTSHDTNRAQQGVPDDRVSPRTSYTLQNVPDNRTPHHTNSQGHYPAIEPSSSHSEAQRWDSSTRPSAYQETYRPHPNNAPHSSGRYQEPAQDVRSMPTGHDAPPHRSYHDGRDYSQQQPPHHSYHSHHDSRGHPQPQPSPLTRHQSYNDERVYSQQQLPPPPQHFYHDGRVYSQDQHPHPAQHVYHDGRSHPQPQHPHSPQHVYHDGRVYSQDQSPHPAQHVYHDGRGHPQPQHPHQPQHVYHDGRVYSQDQPPHPAQHIYHDGRVYSQDQHPHPAQHVYHDGRVYTQDQPPAAQPNHRQSAPRQRTAIACKYCRRRKIRCSGFTADGSGGQCTNCARFKQDCVFTPVSSAQAFVPLIALTEALQNGRNVVPNVYGAHGQRLPSDPMNPNSAEPYPGYHPQQVTSEPQMTHNHQSMPQHVQQPIHHASLPPMNRSPHDRDTLPSPTDSLDSQKRKREADERHFARAAPSAPGQFSDYSREGNAPYRTPALHGSYQYNPPVPSPPSRQIRHQQGENFSLRLPALQDGQQYRSSVPSPPPSQQYGHQGENALAYRPNEDSRPSTQWASVNPSKAPRNLPSPNGSSSSFHSQNPSGNHQPSQLSPYRAEPLQLPLASPTRTNSGGGNHDQVARETERPNQMNIANILERDNKDVDRDMLNRLGNRS